MPDPAPEAAARFPRGFIRNTSVATRLSLVVVLVALISLAITSVVGLVRGGDLAQGLLRDRLTSIGAARADEVERYVSNVERIAIAQAISPSTARAIEDFTAAYGELAAQEPSADDLAAVDDLYVDVVAPELTDVRGRPVNASSLVPQQPAGIHLQANYVVPADDPSLINDAGDGSRWTELHNSLHPSFSEVAIQAGADDLYLIEPGNNTIVYSTAKNIDFATSLRTGPHSGSALAVMISSFGDDPPAGVVAIADFTSYTPAIGAPSAFVASPVLDDGTLVGFVVLRFGAQALTAIATDDATWTGQGDTGETFVVAGDNLMRTDARGFLEDRNAHMQRVTETNAATDEQIRLMRLLGTTVLLQPIENDDVEAALAGPPELVETTNYLGADVLQARRALEIEGLDWAMITEVDQVEIEQPIADFARNLLIAIALFLVTITFLATRWAGRLLSPVRIISSKLRSVRAGDDTDDTDDEASEASVPENSASEFVELSGDIDTMLATLDERRADVRSRAEERRLLLRRLLPPQAAQRAEAGEQNVIDQVAHASIAVLAIRGLGPLLQSGSRDDARLLLDHFVEEADALAKQRGVERIRLTGDSYVAGCGTVRPHIDHAARTVAFALDVEDLVTDLSDDTGHPISVGIGVDSGPVTVGLTGGAGLVYDAWGATVQRAADLARVAETGTVLVSAAARSQLPSTLDIDAQASTSGAFVLRGRRDEAGVT
ncbi:adenylate/guanylate cyclase domain-containing protein [Ilumatobacter sp.]|uniref:adenylate/guanylate cyclase domain-containing protein n=1 Tax=Ilumatobacter sp. TaxID=1967498 RepID=UPI003AF697D5